MGMSSGFAKLVSSCLLCFIDVVAPAANKLEVIHVYTILHSQRKLFWRKNEQQRKKKCI